jgi:tetratricopeptide (TPR) repeat protein
MSMSELRKIKDIHLLEKKQRTEPNVVCRVKILERLCQQAIEKNQLFDNDYIQGQLNLIDSLYQLSDCPPAEHLYHMMNRAQWLHNIGRYEKSIQLCLTNLDYAENTNDPFLIASFRLILANCFARMGDQAKSKEYTYAALPQVSEIADSVNKAQVYLQLAGRYLWMFQDQSSASSLDSASYYIHTLLNLSLNIRDSSFIMRAYLKMNGLYYEQQKNDLAMAYIDSALQYRNQDVDQTLLASCFSDKADIYRQRKQYKAAKQYADSSLIILLKNKNPEQIANSLALLYQISVESGQFEEALQHAESFHEIMDSLKDVEKSKTIHELEIKYHQEKNEHAIRQLAQEKRMYLLLILLALFGIAALIFYFRQYRLKNKQQILLTEQRVNRARMNPHFFFNTLASLQTMAMQKQDHFLLAGSLARFAHIMRETLESTYKDFISLEQEILFLEEYLSLQKLRFPGSFEADIQTHPDLDPEDIMIPSMIIQPFIENSIEHGFDKAERSGSIVLMFEPHHEGLHIEIQDNGQGMNYTKTNNNGHISRASQIIRDRIYLLNLEQKSSARFEVINHPGSGVTVHIYLPIIHSQDIQ